MLDLERYRRGSGALTVHAWLGATWLEQQSDLQLAATEAGLGDAWERLRCELRPGLWLPDRRYHAV